MVFKVLFTRQLSTIIPNLNFYDDTDLEKKLYLKFIPMNIPFQIQKTLLNVSLTSCQIVANNRIFAD